VVFLSSHFAHIHGQNDGSCLNTKGLTHTKMQPMEQHAIPNFSFSFCFLFLWRGKKEKKKKEEKMLASMRLGGRMGTCLARAATRATSVRLATSTRPPTIVPEDHEANWRRDNKKDVEDVEVLVGV
jgi:hypothetical protein